MKDLLACFIDVSSASKKMLGMNASDSLDITKSINNPLEQNTASVSDFFDIAFSYLVTLIIFVLLIVIVYRYLFPKRWKEWSWDKVDKWGLKTLCCITWMLGFIVYSVGIAAQGTDFGILSVAFMSIIHATEMFVGASDISAVSEKLHGNAFYMFMFGLIHILAVICSSIFLIRQIGFFFISKLKTKLISLPILGPKLQNTFVFWGINNASLLLAETICKKFKENPKMIGSFRIIFVRSNDDSNRENEKYHVLNLYTNNKIAKCTLSQLRHLNCLVVTSLQRLSLLNIRADEDIIRGRLGLFSLRRIIKNKSLHTHIFMLGDDGDANVKAALNLTYDEVIKNNKVDIYCHCRKSAKTRSLEYYGLTHGKEETEIHIIDSSHLSVSQLKKDVRFHPVQHATINKDATIDTPFNSLIVGFGETGLEALRFLYEYGAFVDSDKKKSPFHCTVFDKNMEEIKGLFQSQTPFLQSCNEIVLSNCAINSSEYWDIIEHKLIHQLNYIIICPGNDDLSLQTASDLCSMAIKWRTASSPKKLTICVRSYDRENVTRLDDFCKDINDKYQVYGIEIVSFGQVEKLFTYDNIISDSLLQSAMKYNYSYKNSPEGEDLEKVWNTSLGIDKEKDNYCIDEIEEIERKREQNFCNALHGATKLYVLDQCCPRRNIPSEIKENIARLEHERWVACMHINGWNRLQEPIRNENGTLVTRLTTKKLHTDLCPWDEVRKWDPADQKRTQSYDYKVLDVTLKLSKSAEY